MTRQPRLFAALALAGGLALATTATIVLFIAGLSPIASLLLLPLEERFPAFRDDGRPVHGVVLLALAGGAVGVVQTHKSVTIDFDGQPSRATKARLVAGCTLADGSDPSLLIERAKAITTIGNSVRAGVPVEIAGG